MGRMKMRPALFLWVAFELARTRPGLSATFVRLRRDGGLHIIRCSEAARIWSRSLAACSYCSAVTASVS